jgi:mRNA-degrading endonuclease toxin of MazEF toxin-antitoxin module
MPTARLERKLGRIPTEVMKEVKAAILFALDLVED